MSTSPADALNSIAMLPTSRVSWLTPDEISAVSPATGFALRVNSTATMISGASEASGAIHCISMNSSIPKSCPISTRLWTKGSAATRMTPAANTKRNATMLRRQTGGSEPISAAAPIRSGFPGFLAEPIQRYAT